MTVSGTATGGTAAIAGYGASLYSMWSVKRTWTEGDTWTLNFITTAGNFLFGFSEFSAKAYAFAYTLDDRVHIIADNHWFGSSLFDPTLWNVQAPSAFDVTLASATGGASDYNAMISYQGRVALFSPENIQLWRLDADPDLMQRLQDFRNTGTKHPLSVQSLGTLDALYLDTTGVKSLKVREMTLNASIIDVGTPINDLLTNVDRCCAGIEPQTGTYWLAVGTKIYVFSHFPEVQITAWSELEATYVNDQGVHTMFEPLKMLQYNNTLYIYGQEGDARAVYRYLTVSDGCTMEIETSWLDIKSAGNFKQVGAFNVVFSGYKSGESTQPMPLWKFYLSADPWSDVMHEVLDTSYYVGQEQDYGRSTKVDDKTTFDVGRIPVSLVGTHIKFRAVTQDPGAELDAFYLHLLKDGDNIF